MLIAVGDVAPLSENGAVLHDNLSADSERDPVAQENSVPDAKLGPIEYMSACDSQRSRNVYVVAHKDLDGPADGWHNSRYRFLPQETQ